MQGLARDSESATAQRRVQAARPDPPRKILRPDRRSNDTPSMDRIESHYKVHVFVCTNEKQGACCAMHQAEPLRKELKDWVKGNPDWKKRVRINSSGCLDRCKEGIAIAIYPQNRWFVNVRHANIHDIKEVITALMNGVGDQDE